MNKITLYIIVFSCLSLAANSQEKNEDKQLSTTVIAVNSYRPTISDAKKLAQTPTTIDTVLPKPSPTYIYGNDPVQTTFTPDSIQAATMKGEPLDPLYRAYVRGGAVNGINYLA